MHKKKILVVDDDQDLLNVITILLQMKGFEVVTINHPDNIFEIIGEMMPDVIVLDVQLGVADGRQLCKQIKEIEEFCPIPVILFSANAGYKSDAAACFADDFIAKPFDIHIFLKKINHYAQQEKLEKTGCTER